MPAKEHTEDKQLKDSSSHDEALSNSSSQQGSPRGIISKFYDVVLSRDTVQKGMRKIRAKYHNVVFEGRNQIDGIKKMSEGVYLSTREKVGTWCYSITIYNHFTGLWLVKNLPHNIEKIVSYEEFLNSFQKLSKDNSQESEDLAKSFFKEAHEVWINLKNPELDSLKQACLLIVSRAVALHFKLEIEGFSSTLVQLFNALDGNKKDFISNDAFSLLVRKKVGGEIPNEEDFRRASEIFYVFAKRFAVLEFPLTYANQDLLRVLVKIAKDKLDILGEMFLARTDSLLNLVINKLGYEYDEQEREEPMTLLDRYHVIIEKIMLVTTESYKCSKFAIQDSNTYKYLDKHVHFDDRYNDMMLVSQYVYEAAIFAVSPAYKAFNFTYNKVLKEYVFAIADVSYGLMRQQYGTLMEKYSVLKDATLKLRDNVLEIRFNKETFEKLTEEAKKQIIFIYEEIKTLDCSKLKVYGSEAYKKALNAVRGRVKALTCSEERREEKAVENQPQEKSEQQDKQ